MTDTKTFGQILAHSFTLKHAPSFVTYAQRSAKIDITEVKSEATCNGRSLHLPQEDAYLLSLPVNTFLQRRLWLDGKEVPTEQLEYGLSVFQDLRRDPMLDFQSPLHSICFRLSREMLDLIAEDANAPRIEDLQYDAGRGLDDPVIRSLTEMLLPAFKHTESASSLFIDNVTIAICAHVAHHYGGLQLHKFLPKGGLAPWQERRAKEILNANLEGEVSIALLAQECKLSTSHFSRSFRKSTGMAPYQWLTRRRVEIAMGLLPRRDVQLSEISLSCGFSDQSHFTRIFKKETGMNPGAWRRRSTPYESN
jgi:AraC family transcriptional regulator